MRRNIRGKTLVAALIALLLLTALFSGCGTERPAAPDAEPAPAPTEAGGEKPDAAPAPPTAPTGGEADARPDQPGDGETPARPEPETAAQRQDGERFQGVILLEGMEETVQYEHVRNDALGFEMDYEYEFLTRRSEADRECFLPLYEDPADPWNYLELIRDAGDAELVASALAASLSGEYEVSQEEFTLVRAGSCIQIDVIADKGGQTMPKRLQTVYVIPAGDGCLIARLCCTMESAEGVGRRFQYMLHTLALLDRG